jgi:hypothetical protein
MRMPTHIRNAFLDTFKEFPDILFIWKYENLSENFGTEHKNVFLKEWIPQVDVFNHKNLIGFVSAVECVIKI